MDTSEQFALLLHQAASQWRAYLDARLRPWGMTQTAWRTLWLLRLASSRYNQSELALRLGIETPTLVKILDRMEAKSLLRRVPDASDRRQKHIEITEVGLRLAEEIEGQVLDVRRTLLADANPAELEVGIRLLERIVGRTSKV